MLYLLEWERGFFPARNTMFNASAFYPIPQNVLFFEQRVIILLSTLVRTTFEIANWIIKKDVMTSLSFTQSYSSMTFGW